MFGNRHLMHVFSSYRCPAVDMVVSSGDCYHADINPSTVQLSEYEGSQSLGTLKNLTRPGWYQVSHWAARLVEENPGAVCCSTPPESSLSCRRSCSCMVVSIAWTLANVMGKAPFTSNCCNSLSHIFPGTSAMSPWISCASCINVSCIFSDATATIICGGTPVAVIPVVLHCPFPRITFSSRLARCQMSTIGLNASDPAAQAFHQRALDDMPRTIPGGMAGILEKAQDRHSHWQWNAG